MKPTTHNTHNDMFQEIKKVSKLYKAPENKKSLYAT